MIVITHEGNGNSTTYNQVRGLRIIEGVLIFKTPQKQYFINLESINHIEIIKKRTTMIEAFSSAFVIGLIFGTMIGTRIPRNWFVKKD
jgi:hypothetical protein